MSATWNLLRANKSAFELRKLRELLFGREAIYPRSPETCRWRSKGKGTRSERVEKCSPSARTEEREMRPEEPRSFRIKNSCSDQV
jgi:hypothetical protein